MTATGTVATVEAGADLGVEGGRYRAFAATVLGVDGGDRARGGLADGAAYGGGGRPPGMGKTGARSEIEVQSLWFAGEFGRRFTTTDGKPVVVVDFGCWNRSAGPDFSDVVVEVDGERRRGSLELDLEARGWEAHGHATNPAYDDVVLHVFLRPAAAAGGQFFTKTASNREVPQVLVDPESADPPEPWRLDRIPEAQLGRCSHPLREMDAARAGSLLRAAARYRLGRKAARVRRVAGLHGWEQALYQGVAEALGYRRNKLAMRLLAQRLPLASVRRTGGEAEAVLFGAAGFLESPVYEKAGDDTRTYLRGLWESWWKHRSEFGCDGPGRAIEWVSAGTRPVNHPQRRVAALGQVVTTWPELAALANPDQALDDRAVLKYFAALEHDYWSFHFTMASGRSGRAMALVGPGRATDIIANWVVPLHLASANDPEPAWDRFVALPARLDNEKSRRAALRLLGDHPEVKALTSRAFHQQGLLQVYEDFCLEDDSACADCPFPEQLAEWTTGAGERGRDPN